MKIFILLFCLLLLVFGLFFISQDFLAIAFHWSELLIFSILGLIIYFIVRAIGSSLDKRFNKSVQNFIDGKQQELFNDKSLLRTFGFLLITLLPFLLFLLLLALFAAIDFGIYGLMLVSLADRVPIAILIGLGIVVIGTGIAVIIGLYYLFFPPKRKTLGIEIKKDEQRNLWAATKLIAEKIEAKPIDKILITPDPGIGVYIEGSLLAIIFGGGKRVLEIGLPSIHDLNLDEFKAILTHEYGHFSNKDTHWSSFTYSMGSSLISTLQATPGPAKDDNDSSNMVKGVMALNPAYWMLLIFVNLFFRVTNGFSRIREVMADIRAMNLYGGKAFEEGLMKVTLNDLVFSEILQKEFVPKLLQEEKTISNFSKLIDIVYKSINKTTLSELRQEVLDKSASSNIFDSHPALKTRIEYSKKFETIKAESADKKKVDVLFDDWVAINEKIADLYNLRLLYLLKSLETQEATA